MIPGPQIIIACPACQALIQLRSLTSGNTCGAEYWTDGKLHAPMLPDLPAIGACPRCDHVFWLRDAEVVGEIDVWELARGTIQVPEEWNAAPGPLELDEERLLDAIEAELWETEHEEFETYRRERYLRLRAWRKFNDRFRDEDRQQDMLEPDERQAKNMREIEDLFYCTEDFEDLLISAEAARQLGRFETARNILKQIDVESILQRRDQLKRLVEQESRTVQRIQTADEEE